MNDLYFPCNEVKCDIFIGQGCGRMIEDAIREAKKRIWIVTPYLSIENMNLIMEKYDRDVNIKVITQEDEIRKLKSDNSKVKDVIVESPMPIMSKLVKFICLMVGGFAGIAAVLVIFISAILNKFQGFNVLSVFLILASMAVSYYCFTQAPKTKYISYHYTSRLPIYFFKNRYNQKDETTPFIHSKIYLIDDEVFLGSLNFTQEGFQGNFETRIRSKDTHLIEKAQEIILKLLEQKSYYSEVTKLGYRIFHWKKGNNVGTTAL